jgi:amidase
METDLCFMTACDLVTAIRTRDVSAREVVEAHLTQIERFNPEINAIVTLVPDRALSTADRVDAALSRREDPPGALLGLPIAHKDTHQTAGIRTTYGSRVFADNVPTTDELVIERIKAAGAIALGKSNAPEFGAGSHTFNEVFGTTRNPYRTDRSAGGSSGGAAAALAAGMHPVADGSDMGGSLRNPASFCNVVGMRPSPGRVPTFPADTAWSTMGVQGPMARTVGDVALLLSAMAGPDARSPIALETAGSAFAASLDRDLTGLRVAWAPDLGGSVPVAPEVRETLGEQLAVFQGLGCTVEEACPDFSGADEVFRTLRAWQFSTSLGTALERHPDLFKASLAQNIEAGRELTGRDIARAEQHHTTLFHRMRTFFESYDVLLLPVSQVAPFDADLEYPTEIDGVPQSMYLDWMRSAYYISVGGNPALSAPGGFTPDGLPVGLQIVGPHRADLLVLQVAKAFEDATQFFRRRPTMTVPDASSASSTFGGDA